MLRSPGPEWETSYTTFAAANTLIPEQEHDLSHALQFPGSA